MVKMAADGLPHGVHRVILHSKLLTRPPDNGCDEWIVCLVDPGKQVVCGLVVESASEYRPKPTVSSVVLRRGNLHLCPGGKKEGEGEE